METGEAPVRVSARFGDAPEADVHVMQENLSGLLVPILEELTDALQGEINRKVKQAKKRHKKKGPRDIDPFFFIAERLLLRNPKHSGSEERQRHIDNIINRWRQASSVIHAATSLSEWCTRHAQNIIKRREQAEKRKAEKQLKRELRNKQRKRASGFFQGGLTPRTPRSPRRSMSTNMT